MVENILHCKFLISFPVLFELEDPSGKVEHQVQPVKEVKTEPLVDIIVEPEVVEVVEVVPEPEPEPTKPASEAEEPPQEFVEFELPESPRADAQPAQTQEDLSILPILHTEPSEPTTRTDTVHKSEDEVKDIDLRVVNLEEVALVPIRKEGVAQLAYDPNRMKSVIALELIKATVKGLFCDCNFL